MSLVIAVTFSNTAIKGYQVVVVCSMNGLSGVYRGIVMILLWDQINGSGSAWTFTLLPLLVGSICMCILGGVSLVFSMRIRNKDMSKFLKQQLDLN